MMGSGSTRQGNTIDAAEVNLALECGTVAVAAPDRGSAFGCFDVVGQLAASLSPSQAPFLPPLLSLGRVQHLGEVPSTNDLALQAAAAGAGAGVWVADAQTAGRGRGGHGWHSSPGDGLYVSVLLTPRLPALPSTQQGLALAAGLAAWEAIREVCGLTADIRWPNDLVTRPEGGGKSRKLGGVLVETAVTAPSGAEWAMLRHAVIGIGINVAHREFPPELAGVASSLFLEGWAQPDRQPLLIALLRHLRADVARQEAEWADRVQHLAGSPHAGQALSADLAARLGEASTWLRGKRVHVPEDGGYTGVTAGLDPHGFLQVDGFDGVRRTVRSGGVREL